MRLLLTLFLPPADIRPIRFFFARVCRNIVTETSASLLVSLWFFATATTTELMFRAPSVLARLEGVGAISPALAAQIGLVGLAARSSGLRIDVRQNFPYGIYRFAHIPVCTWGISKGLPARVKVLPVATKIKPTSPLGTMPHPTTAGRTPCPAT